MTHCCETLVCASQPQNWPYQASAKNLGGVSDKLDTISAQVRDVSRLMDSNEVGYIYCAHPLAWSCRRPARFVYMGFAWISRDLPV